MLETLYNVVSVMESVMSIVHLFVSLWAVYREGHCPGVDNLYITPTSVRRAWNLYHLYSI